MSERWIFLKSNLFKIIVIRHCVVALPKYVEAILVTSATMMIFTMPKRNDNQGFTNYVCFKCHNLSIPNDRILRNFQRICQKIVFSPTVLTKSLEAISQSEQIMHITVDSPKPKLSTFSCFYLSTRRFTANVQRAYPPEYILEIIITINY